MPRFALLIALLAGCTCAEPPQAPPSTAVAPIEPATPTSPPADGSLPWSQALAALDERLSLHLQRDDSVHRNLAASLLLSRARLTGDYDDYARAEAQVEAAFGFSPPNAGPFLTRASLNYSLHRLDRVEADLDRAASAVLLDDPTRAAIALARGKLRFHQGRYDEARLLVQQAIDLRPVPQPGALATLALIHWRTGNLDDADGLYADALEGLSRKPSETRAWLHLQRGLLDLDRGRWAEALAHYQDAGAVLPGWYLVDEHIAEVHALTGRVDLARPLYEDVAARTGSPEFFDALAGLERAAGNEAGAQAWIDRAVAAYAAQLVQFPEAAYGHALSHYLEFGPPDRALELAEANMALRPYGGSATALIEARLGAGHPQDAAELADATLRGAWRTADLHAAAARAYRAVGRLDEAGAQDAAALALNPHALD